MRNILPFVKSPLNLQDAAMKSLLSVTFLLTALLCATAETVKDREGAVRADKAKLENDPRWIYNDFEKGFEEGRESGKPVLVVLRCVPCLACAGIDAKVLLEDEELKPLLDQFVCVRVINANALDLSKFQFDFDLSFSTLIYNGDGTLYGRYGSWKHQRDPREETTAGFRHALEAALGLHAAYPGNKHALDGKQGRPTEHATPVDMPTLASKYTRNLDWEGKVVQSCVHCHQIGDAIRTEYRDNRRPIPANLVYPFPAPETIGLTLESDGSFVITAVQNGSPADRAGLEVGDEILTIDSQPLISHADLSWALHHVGSGADVGYRKNPDEGGPLTARLLLPEDWRRQSDISRRVGTWPMRAMTLGGILLEDLSDAERKKRGLNTTQMALFAKHVGQYNEHAAAKNAGYVNGDVIVEFDGITRRMSESELIGHLLGKYQPGEKVKTVAVRDGKRLEMIIPMQ